MKSLKWIKTVIFFVILLTLVHMALMGLVDIQWYSGSAIRYVLIPIILAVILWPIIRLRLGVKRLDSILIISIAVVMGSSQLFLTSLFETNVKTIRTLDEITHSPGFKYYQVTEPPNHLKMKHFEFSFEVRKRRKFSRRSRVVKEGLHMIGMAVNQLKDPAVDFIHEVNHYIRGQYSAPTSAQELDYLEKVKQNMSALSDASQFKLLTSQLELDEIKQNYKLIHSKDFSPSKIVLVIGSPSKSILYISFLLMISAMILGHMRYISVIRQVSRNPVSRNSDRMN